MIKYFLNNKKDKKTSNRSVALACGTFLVMCIHPATATTQGHICYSGSVKNGVRVKTWQVAIENGQLCKKAQELDALENYSYEGKIDFSQFKKNGIVNINYDNKGNIMSATQANSDIIENVMV